MVNEVVYNVTKISSVQYHFAPTNVVARLQSFYYCNRNFV